MGNRSEDYLDQLLNSIGGQTVEAEQNKVAEENVTPAQMQPEEQKPEKKVLKKPEKKVEKKAEKKPEIKEKVKKEKVIKPIRFHEKNSSAESFLEEFDREMLELDMEQVISDYEDSLGEELLGKRTVFGKNGIFGKIKHHKDSKNIKGVSKESAEAIPDKDAEPVTLEEIEKAKAKTETDNMFAELEKMLSGNITVPSNPTEEAEVKKSTDDMGLGDLFSHGLDDDHGAEEEMNDTVSSMSEEDEALFHALLSGTEEESTSSNLSDGFEFGNLFGDPVEDVASEEDVLHLLGDMSDDPELAEIGKMLQAQDNKEDIFYDEMETGLTEEEALNYVRNIDEEQPLDKEKRKAKWKFNKWNPEKVGFLQKISRLLFGEAEEEQTVHVHAVHGIEDTTAENDELIKNMEKEAALAEKKAKKAEKKKEQQKQNEEKKKAQAAEKKAREAGKKAKAAEKKAKAAKEVDKTPPLPKKPVFLIFLLAASLVGGVMFASNGVHYSLCISSANKAYAAGNYVEAYRYMRSIKIKEKDDELIREVSILASMQELLRSYPTMFDAEEHEMALDIMIRVVGRYNEHLEEATALDIVPLLEEMKVEAEEILAEKYGITYEQAMELYSMPSRKKYSVELVKILREAGLLEVDTD